MNPGYSSIFNNYKCCLPRLASLGRIIGEEENRSYLLL